MKTNLRMLMGVLLAGGIILQGTVPACAMEIQVDQKLERVYGQYKNDAQFNYMLNDYGVEYSVNFLKDVQENELSMEQMRAGGGNNCYQHVTNIKQTKTYNCGSTTVLQTLYGLNSAGNLKPKNGSNKEKIETLDKEYNVDSQGSIYVYQVRDALNKYKSQGTNYTYVEGASISQTQFEGKIANSLTSGKPVVLHAKTKYFAYYKGKNTGHYLSLDEIDRSAKKVRIVDCNYKDSYYGIHRDIPIKEAYNAVAAENGRYLIY